MKTKRCKKLIAMLLCMAMLLSMFPLTQVSAYSETDIAYPVEGGNIYFDKATGTITDCDDTVTGADIPAEIDGVAVTVIGNDAFYSCSSLTSVTIGDSVTSIGYRAFSSCSSLTSVTIPDSVTTIGNDAFYSCSSLTSVTIPDSVTSIGNWAFSSCSSLTSVTIPDSVTTIGNWAFSSCSSLTSVTIPDSVTTIGNRAFSSCSSLTSVTIGDSVTSIGNWAFSSCSSLTSVTIPDSVTTIGNRAFSSCSSLTGIWVDEMNEAYSSDECGVLFNKDKSALIVCPGAYSGAYTVPDSVTTIGDYAFYSCSSLTSVTIGDSVTSIGDYAFYSCSRLTSVTIPDSVTTIGDDAFYSCSSLTSVTIPDSVTTIGDYAFSWCTSLTSVTIPDSVTTIGDYAFKSCTRLTSVTIPDSVTSIGIEAFEFCSRLTSVTIGDSVTSIGDDAFSNCDSLTDVYYSGTEEMWNEITISYGNSDLLDATIHFNYEPSEETTEPKYEPKESLKFTMSISVGAEMTVIYNIMGADVNSYKDFYLEVKKDVAGGEPVTTVYGITADREQMTAKVNPATGEALMYQVTYKGINAKEMGDNFSTTLYAVGEDGTIYYGTTVVDSIKSYLVGKIDAESSIPQLKTMAVDMLKYGAAAQVRLGYNTENLVTADLTEEQLSYATVEIPEAVNYVATTGTGVAVNTNITVTSRVQLNLSCIYTTATDPNAVKCVITDSEGKVLAEIAATNKGNIMFSAIYENVGAKEMRDVINATFYEGETAISQTVSWSVESYVAQVRAKTNVAEDELNMVNAMLTYGDSVAAYMEAK